MTAVEMLRRMFPSGARIALASYANDRNEKHKFPPRNKGITDPDKVADFIAKWDEPGRAVYFGVNPISEGHVHGKEHVACILVVHADIDFDGIVEEEKTVRATLAKLPLKPSLVVMSGHGYHCYWFYTEPLPSEQIPSHEDRLRRLCPVIAADVSAAEVARILRLPGSHNTKGGDNIEVKVIPALSSWKTYSPAELDRWLERAEPVLTYKPTKREAKASAERNPFQQFSDEAKSGGFDIDEALAAMEMHSVHGNGIDDTMAAVVGAMVHRSATADEVIETLLEPVRRVFERDHKSSDGPWNEKAAINNIKSKFKYFTKLDERKVAEAEDAGTTEAKAKKHLIETSEQFTSNFVPPDYLVDGVILCGFMYALTALTGHCKTGVLLLLSAMIAQGHDFADNETKKGRVLYLAGENPDDVRMRWIAMGEHIGFDTDTIDVCFIPGTFDISAMEKKITAEVEALGGVALVIIDTGPAFFQGDAENDNVDMMAHAKMMRRLINLPGKPTVIAAMHPTKSAAKDNLAPRGGGAFLNEIDGNLTCWREETLVTLHHGKLRGVPFEPMAFEWESVTADQLVDSRGHPMPTVLVRPLSLEEQKELVMTRREDEDEVLALMLGRKSPISYSQIASDLVWVLKHGGPNKSKAQRLIEKFQKDKLVKSDRDGSWLTKEGIAAAEKVILKKPHLKEPQ